MRIAWSGNTLVAVESNGRVSLFSCFADRVEIRGQGWDKRKTKRNPFPDGRVVKVPSLENGRQLAEAVTRRLEDNQ